MHPITYKTEDASFCFDQQEVLDVIQSPENDSIESNEPIDLTDPLPGDLVVVLQNSWTLATRREF